MFLSCTKPAENNGLFEPLKCRRYFPDALLFLSLSLLSLRSEKPYKLSALYTTELLAIFRLAAKYQDRTRVPVLTCHVPISFFFYSKITSVTYHKSSPVWGFNLKSLTISCDSVDSIPVLMREHFHFLGVMMIRMSSVNADQTKRPRRASREKTMDTEEKGRKSSEYLNGSSSSGSSSS